MSEISELLEVNPNASAYYAFTEMHYGRLEWLAEHIRRCDFRIDPMVARKLLAMLERADEHCMFEIRAVRKSGLPPRAVDPQLQTYRNMDMAIEVARKCGFKRSRLLRACDEVGKAYDLKGDYVASLVRPFKQIALQALEEENARNAAT